MLIHGLLCPLLMFLLYGLLCPMLYFLLYGLLCPLLWLLLYGSLCPLLYYWDVCPMLWFLIHGLFCPMLYFLLYWWLCLISYFSLHWILFCCIFLTLLVTLSYGIFMDNLLLCYFCYLIADFATSLIFFLFISLQDVNRAVKQTVTNRLSSLHVGRPIL